MTIHVPGRSQPPRRVELLAPNRCHACRCGPVCDLCRTRPAGRRSGWRLPGYRGALRFLVDTISSIMWGMDGKSVASKLVRDLRRTAGWSQRALAAAAAVPQPTIAEIEGGRREPSLSLLSRLAEATGQVVTFGLEPMHPRSAVATANRVRDRLSGPAGERWSTELRQDGALRAVIDFKDALGAAPAEDFAVLVKLPPGLTGETRWDAFIAAVVEDESAARDVPPPYWTKEKSRFVRPFWYLSDNRELHAWELATAPGAFVRHGVLAAKAELESV